VAERLRSLWFALGFASRYLPWGYLGCARFRLRLWYQLVAEATYLRLRLRYQLVAAATYLRLRLRFCGRVSERDSRGGGVWIDIGHTSLTSRCMIRTQIQIPEPLYREVQRVAREHEWSIAEVLRRGAEVVTRTYRGSNRAAAKAWRLPPPLASELKIVDPEALRDAMEADDEAR